MQEGGISHWHRVLGIYVCEKLRKGFKARQCAYSEVVDCWKSSYEDRIFCGMNLSRD